MASKHATILIVDDDKALLATLARTLELAGYQVLSAQEPQEAKRLLQEHEVAALLLDLQLPGVTDLEVLESVRSALPALPVVVVTAHATVDRAVRALKMGAFDFIQKPIDRDRLLVTLRNALERVRLETERTGLLGTLQSRHEIIGNSTAIRTLKDAIFRVAPTDHKVLIVGETGVGKEVVADAVFTHSLRAAKPFIKVNCAAIPRELIESELFGHRKGAFTGANENKAGKFKLADGGTIFLDEIGDMDVSLQAKVLRVLQEGQIEIVGGGGPETVDVRVIAATNQSLDQAMKEGRFRQDLYYRLLEVTLRIPPLRDRLDDVPLLMDHFLAAAASRSNKPQLKLHSDAIQVLLAHNWPGNVRELKSLAGWISVFVAGPAISGEDLKGWFRENGTDGDVATQVEDYNRAKETFDREYFKKLLIAMQGNMTAVAKAANLDRSGLYRKLKSLGIVD
jgi:two-component system nitrogen regulation response regulator NtrX